MQRELLVTKPLVYVRTAAIRGKHRFLEMGVSIISRILFNLIQ